MENYFVPKIQNVSLSAASCDSIQTMQAMITKSSLSALWKTIVF